MPVVIFKFSDSLQGITGKLANIARLLPKIIADALSSPQDKKGTLAEEDISVWGMSPHYFDVNTSFIQIIILCGDYPMRTIDIDERREIIERKVREIYPEVTGRGFVWILPQQNESFGLL